MIKITLDDQSYQGEPALGTTLADFLAERGLTPTEIVFNTEGRPVATAYTLVHSVNGQAFSLQGELKQATGALTVDEITAAKV
jgi:sulfur carrier protein ThiS